MVEEKRRRNIGGRVGKTPLNMTAVCASREQIRWQVKEIPCIVNTKILQNYPRDMSRERVQYNADRRNETHRIALETYPDTTHFLSIDSYYCDQPRPIRDLVRQYSRLPPGYILGASNWYIDRSVWPAKKRFWDSWTTPEMKEAGFSKKGIERVRGVGGIVIYPVNVWKERPYAIPANFPKSGCEMNHLCQHDPFVLLSFDVKFLHPTPNQLFKPFNHRLRTRLAIASRLGNMLYSWEKRFRHN